MKNVSDKTCIETRNTNYMINNIFFFENRAVYEIMWNNFVERGRPHMTVWRMRIATDTHMVFFFIYIYFADRASQYIYFLISTNLMH